jgi:N-acetylglucosaminyldiphosphoundecaprenol N-acetyl-beta-D-mannosaminyltransferase
MNQIRLLNSVIDNLTLLELLEVLRYGGTVFTPNVDHLMKMQRNQDFFRAYQVANYRVCDSQLLIYIARFLGTPIRQKISGSDLFPAFYRYYHADTSMTIFLMGAAEGVAHKAQTLINQKVQREMVVGCYSPPFGFEHNPAECRAMIDRVNRSGATVLALGVGAPKQEQWIAQYRDQMPSVKVFLAIGATIDFEAGNVQRSPRWMSQVGLEWVYRLICEPKRLWRRYLGDALPFFTLVLKQRLRLYRSPWRLENGQDFLKYQETLVKHY